MILDPSHVIAARRTLYARRFKKFVEAFWPIIDSAPFNDNWHIDALCEHLEAVADGRLPRLLINVPPGTAKSTIVSVLFPAWLWTRDPSYQILSTSHSMELSTRDTMKARDVITSDLYQSYWPIRFRADQNQKTAYQNTQRGNRTAKPFSNLTGARGNLLIVDDPHSRDGAMSDADRGAAVETMLTSAPSRLNDPTDPIIVIMQRFHEDDVSGALLSKNLGYCHLNIPMEYEGGDPPNALGWTDPRTVEGELLFPKKFTAQAVADAKESLGPLEYAGQYQQRPSPKNDGFFKREWFAKRWGVGEASIKCPPREHLNVYMTSDHAPGGSGDWNVVRVWGIDKDRNHWLLDSFREKCTMDVAMGIAVENGRIKLAATGALPLARKWKPLCWFAENDNTWKSIQGQVADAMRATGVFVHVEKASTSGSKTTKATAFRAKAAQGMVYYPEGPVGDAALDELVRFPNAKHDDQVDADGLLCRMADQTIPAEIVPLAFGEEPTDYGENSERERESDSSTFF